MGAGEQRLHCKHYMCACRGRAVSKPPQASRGGEGVPGCIHSGTAAGTPWVKPLARGGLSNEPLYQQAYPVGLLPPSSHTHTHTHTPLGGA